MLHRVLCEPNEAAMRGRPKAELQLSEDEREQLKGLTLRRETAQALALCARIVLACAEGVDSRSVAVRQRVTPQTVSKRRARFVEHRLDGLLDAPRPGAPRTAHRARPRTREWMRSSPRRWRRCPRAQRTGARARWRAKQACRRRRCRASGAPSGCNRTGKRPSSSPATRSSSRRCVTSSGCTWTCR